MQCNKQRTAMQSTNGNFGWIHLYQDITRNQIDMYYFVRQWGCAFWHTIDMFLQWSIVKSTSEPKTTKKSISSQGHSDFMWLLNPLSSNPMIFFYEKVTSISQKNIPFFCPKNTSRLADQRNTYQIGFQCINPYLLCSCLELRGSWCHS